MKPWNIIYGPPGTGKTTRLLNIMEEHLAKGVRPDQIGFMAFTRKAASEAHTRAMTKFGYTAKQLPFFRTIHSLAFGQLGISRNQVFQTSHLKQLGDELGFQIQGYMPMDDGIMAGMIMGDRVMFIEGLSRVRKVPLKQQYRETNDDEVDWLELDRAAKGLARFKEIHGLIDYTDMLNMFNDRGYAPDLEVLIVDEAQDLSPLQWDTVKKLAASSKNTYIAGDDDQAIFRWAGADPSELVNLKSSSYAVVLKESHRIPEKVHKLAGRIARSIRGKRVRKIFNPRDVPGSIQRHMDLESVDLTSGEWLILVRNKYLMSGIEEHCKEMGLSYDSPDPRNPRNSRALKAIVYWEQLRKGLPVSAKELEIVSKYTKGWKANRLIDRAGRGSLFYLSDLQADGLDKTDVWHKSLSVPPDEKNFFLAARRRGEAIAQEPRIKISTIHGAKGGEADNVLLFTDMAKKTYEDMEIDADNEHRVFYVGVTRARENLHIVEPNGRFYYEL